MSPRGLAAAALAALGALALSWWLFSWAGESGVEPIDRTLAQTGGEVLPSEALIAPRDGDARERAGARAARGDSLVRDAAPLAAPESLPVAVSPDALVLQVVDPEGTPRAGIPLRLDPGRSVEPAPPEPQLSDARGRVVFEALRSRLAADSEPWSVRADLPFETAPSLVLDEEALASPVVRFVLPPGGVLDIDLRELSGPRAPSGSPLRLKLLFPDELHELDLKGPEWGVQQGALDAPIHFPWVELARNWEISAWRPQGTEVTRRRARGPERLGERVEVLLVLGRDHPVVSYRVLDPEGDALPGVELELERMTMFGSLERSHVTTDREARFTLDARTSLAHASTLLATHRPREGVAWMARLQLPPSPVDGWNDGGDVLLGLEPLLCAGRVVDALARPVSGAEVLAGREHSFLGGRVLRTQTDERGRFALRGLWLDDQVPLRARFGTSTSREVHAAPGTENLELVLAPQFTISGELLLADGIDPSAVRFVGRRAGNHFDLARQNAPRFVVASSAAESPPLHPSQRFSLVPIDGGPLELLVLLGEHELVRLPEWNLQSDHEVGLIDLRERLHLCELELLGADDPAKLGGELSWQISGTEPRQTTAFHGALVRIVTTQVPIDVDLCPKGYRSARLPRLSGRSQHRLEPALRVRLVLRTDGAIPPPPYRFDAELYRGDVAVSQPVGPRWFTPERREIECLVSTAGPLTARWHLEKHFEGDGFGGATGAHVLAEHWVAIDVRDVPNLQVFDLGLEGRVLEGVAGTVGW